MEAEIVSYLFKDEKFIVMSKGIAIETILYLLVGILVVGIVIYLVYTYVVGSPIGEQECRSMAITWCTGCKNSMTGQVSAAGDPCTDDWSAAGCPTGITATTQLQNCANNYFGATITDCSTGMNFCSTFI